MTAAGATAAASSATADPGVLTDATVLAVGDVVAGGTFPITRDSLVRYAGASGDFNAIHYRDDVAAAVDLPGVLAHGMLTMGLAVQPVIDWLGDPGRVLDYQVRFTRPVVVDPVEGAELFVSAKVGKITPEADAVPPTADTPATPAVPGTARIDLTVTYNGDTVLGKAQVVIALAAR